MISLGETLVRGSISDPNFTPYQILVYAGPIDGQKCTASAVASEATSGALYTFSVQARDQYGSARITGGDRFIVKMQYAKENSNSSHVYNMTYASDGRYLASNVRPDITGPFILNIYLQNITFQEDLFGVRQRVEQLIKIQGSPFSGIVLPGQVDAEFSAVVSRGFRIVQDGPQFVAAACDQCDGSLVKEASAGEETSVALVLSDNTGYFNAIGPRVVVPPSQVLLFKCTECEVGFMFGKRCQCSNTSFVVPYSRVRSQSEVVFSLTITRAGYYQVEVKMGAISIQGRGCSFPEIAAILTPGTLSATPCSQWSSPVSFRIAAGPIDPMKCRAVGAGLQDYAITGKSFRGASFLLSSMDMFGNVRNTDDSQSFHIIVTSSQSTTVTGKFLASAQPGELVGSYVQKSAGLSQVHVLVSGQPIHGSPFPVSIDPGEPSYLTSQVSGTGLKFARKNSHVSLMITMMDYFSNIRTSKFKNVKAQVNAGLGDAEMIVFQGYNRTDCNETTKVCVNVMEQLYRFNPVRPNGEKYTVEDLGGEGMYRIRFSPSSSGKVEFHVLICDRTCCNGTQCEFLRDCKIKGNCDIATCKGLNGEPYTPCVPAMTTSYDRSPFSPQVVIDYSGTRAKNSMASGLGLQIFGQKQWLFQTAGVEASFRIDAADNFGVAADKGGEPWDAFVGKYDPSTGDIKNKNDILLRDTDDGSYYGSYFITSAGLYSVGIMHVDIDLETGQRAPKRYIHSAPFQPVILLPQVTNAALSTTNAATLATAGSVMRFFVQAKDSFGNNQAYQDVVTADPSAFPDKVSVTLSPISSGNSVQGTYGSTPQCTAPIGTTVRTICGPFTMQYVMTYSGLYKLDVRLNEISLKGMPVTVNVQSSKPDPRKSLVFGSGMTDLIAGVESSFSVLVQDSFGNPANVSNLPSFPLVAKIIDGTKERKCNSIVSVATVCALELVAVDVIGNLSFGAPSVNFDGVTNFFVYNIINIAYTATNALASKMHLTLAQQHVASSPYDIMVHNAEIQARSSTASGAGMSASRVGDESEIIISAKDTFQNLMTDAGSLYDVQLTGPTRIRAVFNSTQVEGSVFRYAYRAHVVGAYNVSVTLFGVHLSGSPVVVEIAPNIAVAAKCYVEGEGSYFGTAGIAATLVLYARDSFGNKIPYGGDVFLADVTNPSFSRTIIVPIDNLDGSYFLAFGSAVAGPHSMGITLGGKNIFGSPFTVEIMTGAMDLTKTDINFENNAVAGNAHNISVQERDSFGNIRTDGLSIFYIILPNKREYTSTYISDSTDRSMLQYKQQYLSSITWTQSGNYNIDVQTVLTDRFGRTSRVPLAASPILISFTAGKIFPAVCTASGPGTTGIRAGENASILIHTRDTYGNDVTTGGYSHVYEVFVTYTNPIRTYNFSTADLNNGKYSAWFILTATGSYGVEVKGSGLHISGSPYLVEVVVASLDPHNTLIKGAGINGGAISRTALFNVKLFDSFGNAQTNIGAQVKVLLSDNRLTTRPVLKDLMNGEYQVSFMGIVQGIFHISVIVDNVTVPGSPFPSRIVLQAGAPSDRTSLVVSPLPVVTEAGRSSVLVLELRDDIGIKIEVGDNVPTFSAKFLETPGILLPSPFKEPTPNEGGTYNILLPSITRAGTYGLMVFVQEKQIQGSPFNITIRSTDAYALACRILPMALGEIYSIGTAGIVGQFLVELRDFYGNPALQHEQPGVDIGFATIITGDGPGRTVQIFQSGGFVEVGYSVTCAGSYQILVTLADVDINGVPFDITVYPAEFFASVSPANVTMLQNAVVGRSMSYSLRSLDRFGNVVDTKGAVVHAVASPDARYFSTSDLDKFQPVVAVTKYTSVGLYTGTVSFTRSAQYLFALLFEGEHVMGSPFPLQVGPLAPFPAYSTVTGTGLNSAVEGEIATFGIQTRDQFSNPVTLGGVTFDLVLSFPFECTNKCTLQEKVNIFDLDNGVYLCFYTLYTPGTYRLDILSGGAHLQGSPFSIGVATPLPPVPILGKFLSSGSYISIIFDMATNMGGIASKAPCATLLLDPSFSLGQGCTLFWNMPNELWIRLGSEASIQPGQDIMLSRTVIKNARGTSTFSAGSVRISAPDSPPAPVAIIEGPSQISACDMLTLDARSSRGSGGRDMRFRWSIVPGGVSEESILQSILSQNINAPCPAWFEAGQCHMPVMSVDTVLMDVGVSYQFKLEVTNLFGQKSYTQHFVKLVAATGVPGIYVDGGQTMDVDPSKDLHLSISVKTSLCGNSSLSYSWTAVSASDSVLPAVRTSLTRRLYIPKNTLKVGVEYNYRASVESIVDAMSVIATSDVRIRVTRLSLYARISGGSRCMSVLDSADLLVEVIGNADAVPYLSVEWGCEPWPCFPGGENVILVDRPRITIPPGTLVPGYYKFTASIVGQFGITFFKSTASTMLFVTPAIQPIVRVVLPAVQYSNSRDEIGVLGSPASYTDSKLSYEWRQLRGGKVLDPTKMMSLAAQFQDSLVFASKALVEGASYRFRLEIKSPAGLGFAEVDLMVNQAPSGGSFKVFPTSGFSVDTLFQLEAVGWTDLPDNLPLTYIYTYILDVEEDSLDIAQIPVAQSSHQFMTARLPNVAKSARNASFGLQIMNMGSCDVRFDIIVRASEPPDPQASAFLMQRKIDTAAAMGDMEVVLSLSNCLSSLLSTSLAQRRLPRRANQGCRNDGTNCDNDDLRLYLANKLKQSLSKVVPRKDEAAMFANSIRRTGSVYVNQTTQKSILELTKTVLRFALNVSGLAQETMDSTIGSFSDMLEASLDASSESSIQHNENVSRQISDYVDDMVLYQLNALYVGQMPKVSASTNVQVLAVRTRQLEANWTLPQTIAETKRRSTQNQRVQLTMPKDGLSAPSTVGLTAVNLIAVQWGTDMHPRTSKPIGSDTLTINISTLYQNGTQVRQDMLEAPMKIFFAQEDTQHAQRGGNVFDRCNYWDPGKSSFQGTGSIVGDVSYTHVSCEAFHMTDFATVLFKSLGDVDNFLMINEANPFLRWTPERILAFAVCWILLAVYWISCWYARRLDKRALADLSQQIKYRDQGDAYKTAKSKEEELRARDYVMIKAILKHRMATRYKSWRVQTLQLLKTEHVFGGIIWRPVFSSFTRPRRITCLFIIFIGNLTLNILFLGRGGFDLQARIAAGIVSGIIMFPIGLIFIALFKSVDSETTWKMHRRRRVRRVQESVAVRGAMDILGKKAPQPDIRTRGETFVPHPPMPSEVPSKAAKGAPPVPSGKRPEFIRRASPKDADKKGFLSDAPPPPPVGVNVSESLRRRLAQVDEASSTGSSRSTSVDSVPPPPKAMIGTETFVRRNVNLRPAAAGGKDNWPGTPDSDAPSKGPPPPPPPGKSNRPPPPPLKPIETTSTTRKPPPPLPPLDEAFAGRSVSVRRSNEEPARKEDVVYKPQGAPPPPPPTRDIPAPPPGMNPRPVVPNVDSLPRRAGGDQRISNRRETGAPAPPITASVRPSLQGFNPVSMKASMQAGQATARLRGIPQSLQPTFISEPGLRNPPPPPGVSMYPSTRRTSQPPPPTPPPVRSASDCSPYFFSLRVSANDCHLLSISSSFNPSVYELHFLCQSVFA